MANISHASITDPNIHESKGVATAGADTIYVADGAGSGVWTTSGRKQAVECYCPLIGVAQTYYVICPFAGTLNTIYMIQDIATSVANTIMTFLNNGVAITNSTITLAAGLAGGVVSSSSPTANNTVTAGGVISVVSDGGSVASPNSRVCFVVTRT